MKTKHLFLTLMMLLASATLSWAYQVTDIIRPSGAGFEVVDPEGNPSQSGATYDFVNYQVSGGNFVFTYIADDLDNSGHVVASVDPETGGQCISVGAIFPAAASFYITMENASDFYENAGTISYSSRNPGKLTNYAIQNSGIYNVYLDSRWNSTVSYFQITWQFPDPVPEATLVTLVGEYEGAYYAVGTNVSNGQINAVPVQVVDGEVVVGPGYDRSAITWYRRPSSKQNKFTFQNAMDAFLTCDEDGVFTLENEHTQYSDFSEPIENHYRVIGFFFEYNGSKFVAGSNASDTKPMDLVTYDASKHAHTRNFSNTNYSTICLPYTVLAEDIPDVSVYEILGATRNSEDFVDGMVVEEVTGNMEAGVPYIVKANNAGSMTFLYNGNKVTTAHPTANGLIGNLTGSNWLVDATDPSTVYYFLSSNKIYRLGGTATLTIAANRAAMLLEEATVYDKGAAMAPGRVLLSTNDAQENNAATGVEDVESAVLNWNEPVYNLMGQQVAEGTTGVLIQNGKKFMIY